MTAWAFTPVLQGSFRVFSGQILGGTVNAGGAGDRSWWLAAGTFADFVALAAGIKAALDTATAGDGVTWTVSLVDSGASGFLIAPSAGTFALSVGHNIRIFTGLAATYAAGSTVAASTSDPPYVYRPSYPMANDDCWYEYAREETIHESGADFAVLRGTTTHYSGRVIVDDLTQWRSFLGYARKGIPFRLYHNYPTDTGLWTLNNRDGYLDLVLSAPEDAEAFLSGNATVLADGQLECDVV